MNTMPGEYGFEKDGYKIVGDIHTHPYTKYESYFSPADEASAAIIMDFNSDYSSYLVASSGVYKYEPGEHELYYSGKYVGPTGGANRRKFMVSQTYYAPTVPKGRASSCTLIAYHLV